MKFIRSQSRVASLVVAAAFLLPITPILAGAPEGEQGARVPGMPTAGSQPAAKKHRQPVEVTFTKWGTTAVEPFLLGGVTGGDVAGEFAGEVLQRQVSTNPDVTQLIRLEAIYEVHADDPDHSFTALIRGGQSAVSGVGRLDGVIMSGWRAGARVHVGYQRISNCAGKPAGPCFEGSIRIESDPDE